MTIHVQTLDRKIWRKDLLTEYLHNCYNTNKDVTIDFSPEGSCAQNLGLYRILDEFCKKTGYQKNRITIKTANMTEEHPDYKINKRAESWYEVSDIKRWLKNNIYKPELQLLKYHFANFVSRSDWARLWTATILDKYYPDKTLQTYHYDPERENYNFNGYVGLDDLLKYKCDLLTEAAEFIKTCPRTIDIDFLKTADFSTSIYQHPNSYYPIQHPANLNLLQYYRHIFLDIVVEANVSGNCFLCTEKTWRPIVAKRPFIVVSNPNFLRNLKKLGFQTFDRWWDESYDDWGEASRIASIHNTIKQIAQLNLQQLTEMLSDMQLVLDYNLKTFENLTTDQIFKTFNQCLND